MTMITERSELVSRYSQILENEGNILKEEFAPIENPKIKEITAQLLENQIQSIKNGESEIRHQLMNESASLNTSTVAGWTGVLIKLVRRSTPQLIAHELVSVVPMNGPTGLIFARHSTYGRKAAPNNVALFGAPDSAYSGLSSDGTDGWDQGTATAPDGTGPNPGGPVATDYENDPFAAAGYTTGTFMDTASGEGCVVPTMSLTITSITVEAKTRKLSATYSLEVAQDMQRLHGLDAVEELTRDLAAEISSEVNAELIRTIVRVAKVGAQDTTVPGNFDLAVDSSGRFTEERMRDLLYRIEIESNQIAFDTHMGKANWVLTTANVASALNMMGMMSPAGSLNGQPGAPVEAPISGYAGVLKTGQKVFVDTYQNSFDYVVVGLGGASAPRGTNTSGLFYCPYVPFSLTKGTVNSNNDSNCNTEQSALIFSTRAGIIQNPFTIDTATGSPAGMNMIPNNSPFYRKFAVSNIH